MEMKQRITAATGKEEMRARVTLFGHPLHAILTDLPIGFFFLSVVWNIVALIARRQPWDAMTFWTMLAGLIAVVPTALVGLLDYIKVLQRRHPGSRTATVHLIVNVTATLFFLLSVIFRGGPGVLEGSVRGWTFVLALIGLAILSFGGYLGGRLVYDHGVGINPRDD